MAQATLRPSADIRAEVETKSRALENQQHLLAELLQRTRHDNGGRQMSGDDFRRVQDLKAQIEQYTNELNAIKMDYIEAQNLEDLGRRKNDALSPRPLWPGEGLAQQ